MRYRRIDLNLLAALNLLLNERNVSRTAAALNVSQSTMSGILSRLREVFDDELLVPVGRQLQLTPLGASLLAPTQDAMLRIDSLLATKPQFDAATAARHFVIAASDYALSDFLADALQVISHEAPGLSFDVVQIGTPGTAGLESGEVDFAVMPANMVNTEHPYRVLFEDGYTVIAWDSNRQLGETLDLATYKRLGHVLLRPGKVGQPWFEQWYLNEHGDSRRVEVRVHSFNLMPQMVVGTDRIATVQSRLARRCAQTLPLRLYPLPMAAPKLTEVLQWNRLHDQDPGNRWLRERMLELAQHLTHHLAQT